LKPTLLSRNLKDASTKGKPRKLAYSEGMVVAVCLNTSKVFFENGTSEYFIYRMRQGAAEAQERQGATRQIFENVQGQKLQEKLVVNNPRTADISLDQAKEEAEELQILIGGSLAAKVPGQGDVATST
jgi:paired amphipathic helix protein Sin3a